MNFKLFLILCIFAADARALGAFMIRLINLFFVCCAKNKKKKIKNQNKYRDVKKWWYEYFYILSFLFIFVIFFFFFATISLRRVSLSLSVFSEIFCLMVVAWNNNKDILNYWLPVNNMVMRIRLPRRTRERKRRN